MALPKREGEALSRLPSPVAVGPTAKRIRSVRAASFSHEQEVGHIDRRGVAERDDVVRGAAIS